MSGLGLGALITLIILLLLLGIIVLFSLKQPSVISIAVRNLKGFTKMNLALLSATCVSTIVITGSLIAGDSLRESITNAAYDNLSEVDEIITSDKLFNDSIANRLAGDEALTEKVDHISPLIHMRGIAENPSTGTRTRTAYIIGFDQAFLDFGDMISTDGNELGFTLDANEVYLNENLADEIGLRKGDRVNISFLNLDQLLEAIFLGDLDKTNIKAQFEVKEIIKSESLGRFQLNANRNPPQNIYVPLESLQNILGTQDKVNMILISNEGDEREGGEICDEVSRILENALDDVIGYRDVGFQIFQNIEKGYVKLEAGDVFFSYDYYELLGNAQDIPALDASSPILTYFWNSLSLDNRSVPYSTVTAFDADLDGEFGLFRENVTLFGIKGELAENEIIINNWTAERLQAGVGNELSMNYSIMDEFYNIRYLTKNFTVRYIVDMVGKANDSMLMPVFPGIEGKGTILDWDPLFPFDLSTITDDDEKYWEEYGGTPKAFISLETGVELWKTDIGNITQVRLLPKEDSNLSALTEQVENVLNGYIGMSHASLQVKTVKLDALQSAEGTELFTEMFLAFSAACIIASALLIMLLITLRVEARMTEIGTLRAIGFKRGAINNIFLIEGTILSIIGGFLGVLFGFLFGVFLINGMNTFWSSIVEGSPVRFFSTPDSLVIGFCAGIIISIFTMMFALHHEGKRTVISAMKRLTVKREKKKGKLLPLLLLILGFMILISPILSGVEILGEIGLMALGFGPLIIIFSIRGLISAIQGKRIDNLAGLAIVVYTLFLMYYFVDSVPILELFFLSGFMLLCGFLLMFYHSLMKGEKLLKDEETMAIPGSKRWLFELAIKNAARRPTRTVFTVILFSLTLFVLVSLTINLQGAIINVDKAVEESGGGFQIMGESTNPVFANLADEGSRASSNIHSSVFNELQIEQFKTKGDVGGTCSNLNRAASPRIIGANESFFYDNTFVFASHSEVKDEDNPWILLEEIKENGDIPAIGDYNTIVWILGLDLGSTISVLDESGESVNIKIVGIIGNSIFQGSLIIWDENFNALYPASNGYQLFLFRSQEDDIKPQINELESALARFGFDAFSVESLVIENILIENTYISIFQVTLMFGLIIGTLGFGIVASRNALERRREIGILRAIGFSKGKILRVLLFENSYVILCGMVIGSLSGIIASSVYLIKMHLEVTSWPWLYVLVILAVSFGIAISSALIPILKSSKMSVSNALRIFE
jgi:ABC-type lipoprotein release transport system permease subunit